MAEFMLECDPKAFIGLMLNPHSAARHEVIEQLWDYLTSLFKILNYPRGNGEPVSLGVLSVKELYLTVSTLYQARLLQLQPGIRAATKRRTSNLLQ